MRSTRRSHRSADDAGFTLIEILGAVMILAIVYSVLATSAMDGMRAEGISRRRLEASLLIDEELMEIETNVAAGIVPPIGETEEEIDDLHLLRVNVTPFDPTLFLGEAFVPPETGATTLLGSPQRPEDAFLRIVDMRLQWDEGGIPFEVRRTTLVQDSARLTEIFPESGLPEVDEESSEEENIRRALDALGQLNQ
jgi:prepilin-type N-terminal cleavage/methylation domain-containing protein